MCAFSAVTDRVNWYLKLLVCLIKKLQNTRQWRTTFIMGEKLKDKRKNHIRVSKLALPYFSIYPPSKKERDIYKENKTN